MTYEEYLATKPCPKCQGAGSEPSAGQVCRECDGSGLVSRSNAGVTAPNPTADKTRP